MLKVEKLADENEKLQNELNNIANLMCEISETEKMVFTQLAKTIR